MGPLQLELVSASAAAFLGGALSLFVVIPLLRRTGTVDVPNARSSHVIPTPRGGGIGLVIGAGLGSFTWFLLGGALPSPVLLSALFMGGLGFIDDRRGLSARIRLLGQVAVGFFCGWSLGGLGGGLVGLIAFPVLINAVNFMDGINGISAIFGAVWGGSAIVFGLVSGTEEVALVGAITFGVCLGFLPWNLPRARTFLGDVGSYFLGALVAGGVLLAGAGEYGPLGSGAWILLGPVAIYLADTGWTLMSRLLRGERVTQAHRDHIYQRLVDLPSARHWSVSMGVGVACTLCAGLVYLPWSWLWIAVVVLVYALSPLALNRAP